MENLSRIHINAKIMGGKPCIKGTRITVGNLVGLVASDVSFEEILESYPDIERKDLMEALMYAAWRAEKVELELAAA